jgi:hypothetical protein
MAVSCSAADARSDAAVWLTELEAAECLTASAIPEMLSAISPLASAAAAAEIPISAVVAVCSSTAPAMVV